MLKYQPIAHDGGWHAAYLVPGTDDLWSSVCDCTSYASAVRECERLNGDAVAEQRAVREDHRLRGLDFGQQVQLPV